MINQSLVDMYKLPVLSLKLLLYGFKTHASYYMDSASKLNYGVYVSTSELKDTL